METFTEDALGGSRTYAGPALLLLQRISMSLGLWAATAKPGTAKERCRP